MGLAFESVGRVKQVPSRFEGGTSNPRRPEQNTEAHGTDAEPGSASHLVQALRYA